MDGKDLRVLRKGLKRHGGTLRAALFKTMHGLNLDVKAVCAANRVGTAACSAIPKFGEIA